MNDQRSQLSFLFDRLIWPSGLVRERACVQISNLLTKGQQPDYVRSFLLSWMKSQGLESVAIIGLLILLHAKESDPTFSVPAEEEVLSNLSCPSALSWILLADLLPNLKGNVDWISLNSGSAPDDFNPSPMFLKYPRTALPAIYASHADDLEGYGIPFWKHWAYEWENILHRIKKTARIDSFYHFWDVGQGAEHCNVFDIPLSEVYRSSYLRTIAWAAMSHFISPDHARSMASDTCPLTLRLWHVKPGRKPDFWPHIHESEGLVDTVAPEIWSEIGRLYESQRVDPTEMVVSTALGRIHEGKMIYDLEIYGVFQGCLGPAAPKLEEVADWCRWKPTAAVKGNGPRLGVEIKEGSQEYVAETFGDWHIVCAGSRMLLPNFPRWQYWRAVRDVWLPSSTLTTGTLNIKCSSEALIYSDQLGDLGKWLDWTDSLRERLPQTLLPSTGNYLMIKREAVRAFAEKHNMVFSWVCRITGFHRKYRTSPYETFTDSASFGTTSLVIS